MKVREGLLAGRSHIVFILGLVAAFALIFVLEHGIGELTPPHTASVATVPAIGAPPLPLAGRAALSADQTQAARIAWSYFEQNTDAMTGLVNSADKYPSTTMWETGSYLDALLSASQLGIIDPAVFDDRVGRLLASLGKLPLFEGKLPNKAYDTRSLAMTDYTNQPTDRGLGWSALDIARLLAPIRALQLRYPVYSAAVDQVLAGWSLHDLVANGELQSSFVAADGTVTQSQEGRLGYEQYAARSLLLFGLDALQSAQAQLHLQYEQVLSEQIPVDDRLIGDASPAFTTSEPFLLEGLEFGLATTSLHYASAVYRAQEERWQTDKVLTAVSEGHLSQPPYFAYATVWGNGAPWAVMDLHGKRFDPLRTLSTKSAFAWDALFSTDYTGLLTRSVADLAVDGKGWQEGRYEVDGTPNAVLTANTNAIILLSLSYRSHGPLL